MVGKVNRCGSNHKLRRAIPKKRRLPHEKVAFETTLRKAWRQIRANALHSLSDDTRNAAREFEKTEERNLRRLSDRVRAGTFKFPPACGYLKKKKRPLVIADLESRIIQRAILDVLQEMPQIAKFLEVPTSFGAIRKKGVPVAISAVCQAIDRGAQWYLKSDIKQFFTQIPRPSVISTICGLIDDERFVELLNAATNLEIANLESIPHDKRHYFEFDSVGTPQGCCLSPIFGNILLYDFDILMNQGDITCLRYLDDFIILGPNRRAVQAAFRRARKKLLAFGLDAYTPDENPDKATVGQTAFRFEYLGIEIDGVMRRPCSKSVQKLYNEIDILIARCRDYWASSTFDRPNEDGSFAGLLTKIHRKVKGWGNQYFFCNDDHFFHRVDTTLDTKIKSMVDSYAKRMRKLSTASARQKRRLLGIHLLVDSNRRELPLCPSNPNQAATNMVVQVSG